MPTQITKLTNKGYLVNGKAIYQNIDGVWEPQIKLEYYELHTFKKYLKSVYPSGKNIINN